MLRTQALADVDLIVSLLSAEHGRLRGVARAARRSRRRFGGALEPLTRVRAVWTEKEGRDLHRIEALEGLRSFAAMQADPVRQAACAVLAEVSEALSHEGQADPAMFRLLAAVLEALEGGAAVWSVIRYFELWTLRIHGLLPAGDVCADCSAALGAGRAVWLDAGGESRCASCARRAVEPGQRLGRDERAFLDAARRIGPAALPPGLEGALARGVLARALRGMLESFAERRFRAYRHLEAATLPQGGRTA